MNIPNYLLYDGGGEHNSVLGVADRIDEAVARAHKIAHDERTTVLVVKHIMTIRGKQVEFNRDTEGKRAEEKSDKRGKSA